MKRLIEQTLCDHGEIEPHVWFTKKQRLARECPGGSSREVTVDYEAATDTFRTYPRLDAEEVTKAIVDAALGRGR